MAIEGLGWDLVLKKIIVLVVTSTEKGDRSIFFTYNAILEATLSKNEFSNHPFSGLSTVLVKFGFVMSELDQLKKKMPHQKYQTLGDSSHKTKILSKTHQISNILFKTPN